MISVMIFASLLMARESPRISVAVNDELCATVAKKGKATILQFCANK
jgi:hypothetical protein